MMLLSSTLTICNACIKCKVQSTFFTLINNRLRHSASKFNRIMKELRLPERPQRPLVPFFIYKKEIQASVIADHPNLALAKVNTLIADMWHSLDKTKKEKYCKEFNNEMVKHRKKMAEYNDSLTADDRNRIRERKIQIEKEIESKENSKSKRIKRREFKRPIMLNNFFRYMYDWPDHQPGEKNVEYIKRKSSEWSKLSQSEKEKFKPPSKQLEKYKVQLLEWKTRMVKMGNYDLAGENFFRKTDKSEKIRKANKKSVQVHDDKDNT